MKKKLKKINFTYPKKMESQKTCASGQINFNFQVEIKSNHKVECCICFESTCNNFTLVCNHTYCKPCIAKYINKCKESNQTPLCPTCREAVSLGDQNRLIEPKPRRSARVSRTPLRFTTNGREWSCQ